MKRGRAEAEAAEAELPPIAIAEAHKRPTPQDAFIVEAALHGLPLEAVAPDALGRWSALLFGGAAGVDAAQLESAWCARGVAWSSAEEGALEESAGVDAEAVLREHRAAFHYARTAAQLDARREELTQAATCTPAAEWPREALARIRGTVLSHWMTTRDLVLGRGAKADLQLSHEGSGRLVPRQAAVLLADGRGLLLRNVSTQVVLVDGAPVLASRSVRLPPVCTVMVGGAKVLVETHLSWFAALAH